QRVAADAIEQPRLLLFGARDAHHPFGVGELAGEIPRLLQLYVGRRRVLIRHPRGGRRGDVVADRADAERVFARLQAIPRETVAALLVRGHADLDDGSGAARGDDDAFHLAFGFGADNSGDRRLTFSPDRVDERWKDHRGGGGKCQHQIGSHSALLMNCGILPHLRCGLRSALLTYTVIAAVKLTKRGYIVIFTRFFSAIFVVDIDLAVAVQTMLAQVTQYNKQTHIVV